MSGNYDKTANTEAIDSFLSEYEKAHLLRAGTDQSRHSDGNELLCLGMGNWTVPMLVTRIVTTGCKVVLWCSDGGSHVLEFNVAESARKAADMIGMAVNTAHQSAGNSSDSAAQQIRELASEE